MKIKTTIHCGSLKALGGTQGQSNKKSSDEKANPRERWKWCASDRWWAVEFPWHFSERTQIK